jgi:hypothetical protein
VVITHSHINKKNPSRIRAKIRRASLGEPGGNVLVPAKGRTVRIQPSDVPSGFAKYRGIGNPGIADRRKDILTWSRRARGR